MKRKKKRAVEAKPTVYSNFHVSDTKNLYNGQSKKKKKKKRNVAINIQT